jgi:hypothetical protein
MDNELSQFGTGVREGDVIAGKYRVEKVLGVGGMGVVVAARHCRRRSRTARQSIASSARRAPR